MVNRKVVRTLLALLSASLLLSCGGGGGGGTPDSSGSSTFPLHVEAGKRYLVDAQNKPFLIHGDTAWSLMVQLSRSEIDQYLEDRRQRGFNAILVNLIEHYYADSPPRNKEGEAPFTVAGDFSRPNDRYFALADYVIAKAAEKGILVLLAPAYAGFGGGGEGWMVDMRTNGTIKLQDYGQYVGKRYKGFSNILWVHGGDFDALGADKDLVRAVVNGIRIEDTRSLHTYHGGRGTTALEWAGTAAAEPWLSVNNIYTNSTFVVSEAFQEYQRPGTTMPFFLIEADYENSSILGQGVRAQAYQAVLSGASGQMMGNFPVWHFNANAVGASNPTGETWQQALNSPGARSMQIMREFLNGVAWWKLEPDINGNFVSGILSTDADRLAAALANDRSFGVVYIPTQRAVTVDLSQLAGPRVIIRWCDPTNGVCSPVAGNFTSSGTTTLSPTGSNNAGEDDWLLVLQSST